MDRFPFATDGTSQNFPWEYFRRTPGTVAEISSSGTVEMAELWQYLRFTNTIIKAAKECLWRMQWPELAYTLSECFRMALEEGRYFSESSQCQLGICDFGSEMRNTLLPWREIIGKEVKIKGMKFVIFGVLRGDVWRIYLTYRLSMKPCLSLRRFSQNVHTEKRTCSHRSPSRENRWMDGSPSGNEYDWLTSS